LVIKSRIRLKDLSFFFTKELTENFTGKIDFTGKAMMGKIGL